MKVTREKEENRQVWLNIEMEPAEMEEALDESFHRLAQRADIPGFRKGKAPREVLERHIGKDRLLEEALNTLLPQAYEKALKEQELEPFASPSIEITQSDPMIFKATVPLKPVVELGDYQSLRLKPEPPEAIGDELNNMIEQLRRQHGSWEPAERAAGFDDLVMMDVDSQVEDKPFINQQGVQYQILKNQAAPAPGFAEQLVGMKGGEEKEFKLPLPADYAQAELAGKEASFKIKVNEVKQLKLPELNDEFAVAVNPEFKSFDGLKKRITENLKLMAEDRARMEFEEKVVDAAVDLSQVDFPPVLVETEIDRTLEQQARQLQANNMAMEEYLSRIGKTGEELREELRPAATKRVFRSLVLGRIAELEKIEVKEADINAELDRMIQSAGEKKDEARKQLDTPQVRSSLEQIVATRKTVQRLVEIAEGPKRAVKKTKGSKKAARKT
ncbi:MAG: trigger factor [Dehalococcoidia bacterium]|nr:MAG: trigger factor [Dehalococcoidia bacterium]